MDPSKARRLHQYNFMIAGGFTAADLDANRNGYMTNEQRIKLRHKGRKNITGYVLGVVFFGLLSIIWSVFFVVSLQHANWASIILFPGLIGCYFTTRSIASAAQQGKQRASDRRDGDVGVICGHVFPHTHELIQVRVLIGEWQYRQYRLAINGLEFKLSRAEWEVFSHYSNCLHTLYFALASRTMLSAEPLRSSQITTARGGGLKNAPGRGAITDVISR